MPRAAHSWHNWASGEPNNSSNNEDCGVVYDSSGEWNDGECSGTKAYVCESN